MISLHIKGDLVRAYYEADARAIELTSVQCRYRSGIAECFASCRSTIHNLNQVRAWYHEDCDIIDGYGYPAGTLLVFSEDELLVD